MWIANRCGGVEASSPEPAGRAARGYQWGIALATAFTVRRSGRGRARSRG